MESLKNTTDKNKINIQYDDIKEVTMRYGRSLLKYIGLDIDSGILEYGYCGLLGRRGFPKGYFDGKSLILKKKYIQYAKELMMKCLNELTFEKGLDELPEGASYEAYLRLEDSVGRAFYYTNTHVSKENAFCVETEKVAERFMELFVFLEKQCSFPYKRFSKRMFFAEKEKVEECFMQVFAFLENQRSFPYFLYKEFLGD